MHSAKKPTWHLLMLQQGRHPKTFDALAEAVQYYNLLYTADAVEKHLKNGDEGNNESRGEKRKAERKVSGSGKRKKVKC
jgi:hypothetical protein